MPNALQRTVRSLKRDCTIAATNARMHNSEASRKSIIDFIDPLPQETVVVTPACLSTLVPTPDPVWGLPPSLTQSCRAQRVGPLYGPRNVKIRSETAFDTLSSAHGIMIAKTTSPKMTSQKTFTHKFRYALEGLIPT